MRLTEIEIPSNRKFGLFFSVLFLLFFIYNYYLGFAYYFYIFGTLSAVFFIVTLINEDLLLPLNKFWMRLGFLLGVFTSPIVLSLIFFGMFTPLAFLMRISGRDELRIRCDKKITYWIRRESETQFQPFNNQF